MFKYFVIFFIYCKMNSSLIVNYALAKVILGADSLAKKGDIVMVSVIILCWLSYNEFTIENLLNNRFVGFNLPYQGLDGIGGELFQGQLNGGEGRLGFGRVRGGRPVGRSRQETCSQIRTGWPLR